MDVMNTSCGHPDCSTRPSFGVEGSNTRKFCAKHMQEGMGNPSSGRVFGGEASSASDGGSTANRAVGRAGKGRKRKDHAFATLKVERGVPMSTLSSAAEAVRYVIVAI